MKVEDTFPLITSLIYLILCPYTKVEESFNIQAAHDIIYHGPFDIEQFDHFEFPGVVPRTFVGILPISLVATPIVKLFTGFNRIAALLIVRGILCCTVWYSLIRFKNALCSRFRYESLGFWFMAFSATQFHLCFYMSRTLPNTFGLILVLWAFESDLRNRWRICSACLAISTLIFRCDTLLLAAPLGLKILISKQATFFEFVSHALALFVSCLALTICVDSYFWNQLVWPEGVVLYFNTILNKSHEWGTQPVYWYFTSAFPRGLLTALPMCLLGLFRISRSFHRRAPEIDRDLMIFLLPAIVFVLLYSILPHKELRFVMPVFPVFNAVAAVGTIKTIRAVNSVMVGSKQAIQSLFGILIILNISACIVFASASYRNYPGGDAIVALQDSKPLHCTISSPCRIHVDPASAMTGVSRFLQYSDEMMFDKNESESIDFLQYDFLITATPTKQAIQNAFQIHTVIEKFHRVDWRKARILTEPYIYVLERNNE